MFDHLNVNFRILIVILMAQKRRRRKIQRLSSQCDKVFGKEATTSGWNLMHTLNFHTCDKAHSIWILMVIKRAINKDVKYFEFINFQDCVNNKKVLSETTKWFNSPIEFIYHLKKSHHNKSITWMQWDTSMAINCHQMCMSKLIHTTKYHFIAQIDQIWVCTQHWHDSITFYSQPYSVIKSKRCCDIFCVCNETTANIEMMAP